MGYEITKDKDYETYLNKYDVVYLDMTQIIGETEGSSFIVYLPKHDSDWPALVIELKWNEGAEGAINQIVKKKYPEALKGYDREILLVGISYDKAAPAGERKHSCRIVKID